MNDIWNMPMKLSGVKKTPKSLSPYVHVTLSPSAMV